MKKENQSYGNRNSRTGSKTGKQEVKQKTIREIGKEIAAQQKDFLRKKREQDGRTPPPHPSNGEGGKVAHRNRNRSKALNQLCVGDSEKLQVRSGQLTEEERKEQQINRQYQRALRRSQMTPEEKQSRRAAFRILGGIWVTAGKRNEEKLVPKR